MDSELACRARDLFAYLDTEMAVEESLPFAVGYLVEQIGQLFSRRRRGRWRLRTVAEFTDTIDQQRYEGSVEAVTSTNANPGAHVPGGKSGCYGPKELSSIGLLCRLLVMVGWCKRMCLCGAGLQQRKQLLYAAVDCLFACHCLQLPPPNRNHEK